MKKNNEMEPRITPIEKPKGLFRKLMFYFLKQEFGKVITPAKVIYARYPKIGLLVKKIYDVENSLKLVKESEKFLIQNFVATLNRCTFCMDISKKKSIGRNVGFDKFSELMIYKYSDLYTPREKVIFAYLEEMTQNIKVSDDTYQNLKKFCSDEEIIEITYISASENCLNRLIKPLNIGSDELCTIS